jgi:hypothetical protein
MTFLAQLSGEGEYVFESDALPGFYLTVDKSMHPDGRPFLAESWGSSTAVRDPRHRFAIYASRRELQLTTTQFQPILPILVAPESDSKVLTTHRSELSRYQLARNDRPSSYFLYIAEIDHLAEIQILTRFMPSEYFSFLRMHDRTALTVA